MGSSFCNVGNVPEETTAIWYPPRWAPKMKQLEWSVPYAERSIEKGEIIEKAYCLDLDPQEVDGSFVKDHCFRVKVENGSDRLLIPFGWGLLYGRNGEHANLEAEHRFEPPPAPPNEKQGDEVALPCHWIFFRALHAIEVGEELIVRAYPNPSGTVFGSMFQELHGLDFNFEEADDNDEPSEGLTLDPSCPLMIGASPVHNVGVFATRDIMEGEVLELVPCLPVSKQHVHSSKLMQYVFGSPHECSESVHILMLGLAMIYNHGKDPDVSYCGTSNPFVSKWVADRDIEKGEEVFSNYGDEYFMTRDMREVIVE